MEGLTLTVCTVVLLDIIIYKRTQKYYVINKNNGMAAYFMLVLEEIGVETFAHKYSYPTSEPISHN